MSSPGKSGLFSGRCPLRRWYRRSTRCSWTVKTHVIAPASRCTWMATCWTTFQSCAALRGCRRAQCYAWWKVCLEIGQPAKGGHIKAGPGSTPLTLAGHQQACGGSMGYQTCGGSMGAQACFSGRHLHTLQLGGLHIRVVIKDKQNTNQRLDISPTRFYRDKIKSLKETKIWEVRPSVE